MHRGTAGCFAAFSNRHSGSPHAWLPDAIQASRLIIMFVDNLLIQYRSGSETTSSQKVAAIHT
jgi:hypothetical protein